MLHARTRASFIHCWSFIFSVILLLVLFFGAFDFVYPSYIENPNPIEMIVLPAFPPPVEVKTAELYVGAVLNLLILSWIGRFFLLVGALCVLALIVIELDARGDDVLFADRMGKK